MTTRINPRHIVSATQSENGLMVQMVCGTRWIIVDKQYDAETIFNTKEILEVRRWGEA